MVDEVWVWWVNKILDFLQDFQFRIEIGLCRIVLDGNRECLRAAWYLERRVLTICFSFSLYRHLD
jgi:hypothetical protein